MYVCVCVLNIQIVDETILFAQCKRKDIGNSDV